MFFRVILVVLGLVLFLGLPLERSPDGTVWVLAHFDGASDLDE
jgi:hypothetical protein